MASNQRRAVDLVYTPRAQRQDAENAMGSDPIRAIIELVTNSDDAYARDRYLGDASILIRVERRRQRPSIIEVHDRASGMSIEQLEQRLARAGERTSGFESGEDVRGLFGRGAKDVAHFGPVRWVTVHNGQRSTFTIDLSRAEGPIAWIEGPEVLQGRQGRRSGTTVSIEVQKRFALPMPKSLPSKLSRHYALRPILRNRRGRDLKLDTGDGARKLTYHEPIGVLLEDEVEVAIEGYPGMIATITLSRAERTLADGEDREYWHHSLLIRAGSAAYDIFNSGKYRREPNASLLGHFFGTVNAPGINDLIRSHDQMEELGEQPPAENPIRMVKRDRSGLVARGEHPFVDALYSAIEKVLDPHVDQLRRELQSAAGQHVGEDLQRRLNEAGRVISRFLRDEIDSGGGQLEGQNPPQGLSMIPERRVVPPNSKAAVTVRYLPREAIEDSVATVVLHESGQPMSRPEALTLQQRPGGFYSKSIPLGPRPEGSATAITVSVHGEAVHGEVLWEGVDVESIDDLQFEHAHSTVSDGGQRRLRLLAPFDLIADRDDPPELSISGDSGLTLLGVPSVFHLDPQRNCLVSVVTVQGHSLGARARLLALAGGDTAETRVEVRAAGVAGFVPKIEEHDNQLRAWMVPEEGKIVLNGKHPALARYLGSSQAGWPGQNSLPFRSMLAELIAATAVRSVLTARHQEPIDVNDALHEYETNLSRLVPRLHRAVVTDAEARHASSS